MKKSKILRIGITIVMIIVFAGLEADGLAYGKNQLPQMNDNELIELTPENLETFLDEFIPEKMEISHVPGMVITVVQGSEIILAKGYGYADIENKIPMTAQSTIRAGSVSKSILATGVIKLIEQGVLDLNTPVSAYISDLDFNDEFGPASTIGQLLTHTSGYQENVLFSHSPDLDSDETLGEVLRADLPSRVFPPDLISSYSDWNFSLLGYAIEGATGKPYETVMKEILFDPVGMEYSTYQQPLPEEILSNMATGYGWKYTNSSFEIIPHDFVRMSPGIALVTNGEDMGNYMRMLLSDGELNGIKILENESLELLLSRQGAAHPYSRGWSYGYVENTISGRKVMYKDGNGIGFATRVVLMPEHDLGIFVSTNHRNLGEGLWLTEAAMMTTRTLLSEIMENFIPESETSIPEVQPITNSSDHLNRFTGQYQKAGIPRDDFFKLEGLLEKVDVTDNGDGTLQIGSGYYQEVEPLVFQNKDNPGFFVIFVENQDGDVEFLTFGGTGSYQKVPWFQTRNIQIILPIAIILISLSMLISWAITRQGHWMVLPVSLLNIVFVAGIILLFIPSITDLLIFYKTIPFGVKLLFAIPWLILVLSLSLPVILFMTWKNGDISWWARIHYMLVTASSFTLFWIANFWNLILR